MAVQRERPGSPAGTRTRAAAHGDDRGIVHALNAEWRHLAAAHDLQVADWRLLSADLADCRGLDDVLTVASDGNDRVLAFLLQRRLAGDQLAGRVVLQSLLGRMVAMARRDQWATVDDYVSQLWVRISTYPLQARPQRIAANLALDTLKAVVREHPPRRQGAHVVLVPGDLVESVCLQAFERAALDYNVAAELTATEVIAGAARLGLIDPLTRRVLCTVYAQGLSGKDAAKSLQMSTHMVRFRCSRAVRRMAHHAQALADAA